jgi:hypothetical protein
LRWRGVLSIAGVESRPVEGRICGRQMKGMWKADEGHEERRAAMMRKMTEVGSNDEEDELRVRDTPGTNVHAMTK